MTAARLSIPIFIRRSSMTRACSKCIAEHCHSGWGETEIHLHHGIPQPDTAENTRRMLTEFRDRLAFRHRCLAVEEGSGQPRYCFVHGNFALANSAGGRFCGVDSEMKVLAETGCYADFTLPTGVLHPAQTAKINSLYECAFAAGAGRAAQKGNRSERRPCPAHFSADRAGPVCWRISAAAGVLSGPVFESGAITQPNPMSLHRLALWKQARIRVAGRPDWLFIKLHCHSMDPTQKDVVIGDAFRKFLEQLVGGARSRKETLHFVTAREMANIILAACDGKEGNPGEYRDYRFKTLQGSAACAEKSDSVPVSER